MKKIIALIMSITLMLGLAGCGTAEPSDVSSAPAKQETLTPGKANVYVLSGPTGIGAANLWADSVDGKTENEYEFTCVSDNTEIVAAVSNGSADIAAVATNMASSLYNKTQGGVTVLAVNTTGVLSMLAKNSEIKTVADLKGKTIYAPGQGANPEYILRYVLTSNGIDPDKDVTISFVADGSELPAVWAKDSAAVIMAPQPVATVLKVKNTDAVTLFDMTEEFNKISADSSLMMGCVIVRNEFLNANPDTVEIFLKEYEQSINAAKADTTATGELCKEYGILATEAAVTAKAIPNCGLTFVSGKEMKTGLSGYLKVMFDANPKSVGGKLPADDFYYAG